MSHPHLHQRYPNLSVTGEPAVEPVDVSDAMEFAQYEDCDEASTRLMASLLVAARRLVERDATVALITQERTATYDRFPQHIELRIAPIQSIDSITYIDAAGASQALASSAYQSDLSNIPPRIVPASGQCWPSTQCDRLAAVSVVFTAGYGDTAADVPEESKLAIKLLAKEWFWNRCAMGDVGRNVQRVYGSLIETLSWRPQFA